MANIITGSRILSSLIMLLFPAFSPAFYGLYIFAGFTDMIDGLVARKTDKVSEFGSRLDTIADVVFILVCLIKLLPVLDIPIWLWLWIGVILLIKVINIASGFVMYKKLVAEHTLMNKITGLLLFVLPLTLSVIDLRYSSLIACVIATIAAIQEGHYIRTGKIVE